MAGIIDFNRARADLAKRVLQRAVPNGTVTACKPFLLILTENEADIRSFCTFDEMNAIRLASPNVAWIYVNLLVYLHHRAEGLVNAALAKGDLCKAEPFLLVSFDKIERMFGTKADAYLFLKKNADSYYVPIDVSCFFV